MHVEILSGPQEKETEDLSKSSCVKDFTTKLPFSKDLTKGNPTTPSGNEPKELKKSSKKRPSQIKVFLKSIQPNTKGTKEGESTLIETFCFDFKRERVWERSFFSKNKGLCFT